MVVIKVGGEVAKRFPKRENVMGEQSVNHKKKAGRFEARL